MKQFLLILMTMVAFAACKNNSSGGAADGTEKENKMTIGNKVVEGPNKGSFNLVNAPGKTAPVKMLADKYWVIKGYIQHGDKEAQQKNEGRWYKFNEDGTFDSGQWKEKTANGSWTFDEKSKVLKVDSNIDAEDSEWNTQMTTSGNTMVIIGTKTFNQTHIQGKMIKLDELPAKGYFSDK